MVSVPSRAQTIEIDVGVYEMPPKIFKDERGQWAGFWYDIVEHISRLEGWKVNYVEGTWTECMDRLEAGQIDVMVDVAYSKERDQEFDFNNVTVYNNWGVIYAREHGTILDFYDLNNKTVAVMNDSIHTTGIYGIMNLTAYFGINCTFLVVQDYLQVFEMVQNGTADAGAVNRLFGLLNQNKYEVVETSLFFNPSDLKFAFPKHVFLNDMLIQRIDHHVTELKKNFDSIYYISIKQHFMGAEVVERIPDWLIYLITTVIVAGIVFVLMSAYLERKVQKRTRELQEANARLELVNKILLDTVPSGVLLVDDKGEIILMNNSFHTLYGKAFDDIIETSMNISDAPENAIMNAVKKEREKLSGTKNSSLEHVKLGKKMLSIEPTLFLELFSSHIRIQRYDRFLGTLHVFNDVSPFVELEKTRQRFVSMVSHELSTPLTAINLGLYNIIKYRKTMEEEQLDRLPVICRTESHPAIRFPLPE